MLNQTIVAAFIATSAVAFGIETRPLIPTAALAGAQQEARSLAPLENSAVDDVPPRISRSVSLG